MLAKYAPFRQRTKMKLDQNINLYNTTTTTTESKGITLGI